jgi:hypothetical protein
MGNHWFVEVREMVADEEHAGDYEKDVSLDWLVAVMGVVEEEEVRQSMLRRRDLKSVKKRQELGEAVLVEEQLECHWRCLPQL